MVRALYLSLRELWFQLLAILLSEPWVSCSHMCASVSKQSNLVLVKGHWCLVAGNVNVGLVLH